jgi:hypothetical protein
LPNAALPSTQSAPLAQAIRKYQKSMHIEAEFAAMGALPNFAWSVHGWPVSLWPLASLTGLRLSHVRTRVVHTGSQTQACRGQTLWVAAASPSHAVVGVSWDWVRLDCGVVCLADPMGVVSNIELVDEAGATLSPLAALVELHAVLHPLDWQSEVEHALAQLPEGYSDIDE